MKKMIIIIMVVLTLAGYQKQAKAGLAKRYFPLNVGNSWTYTNYFAEEPNVPGPGPAPPPPWPPPPPIVELTFTIIGTEEIDGHTYYVFNDHWNIFPPPPNGDGYEPTIGLKTLFRCDPTADRVIMRLRGSTIERIRYDFMGGEWNAGSPLEWCRLKPGYVTCEVPAGEFSDCIKFELGEFYTQPGKYTYGEYMAPNVGIIKYVIPGSGLSEGKEVTFKLKNYTIIPQPAIDVTIDLAPDLFEVKVEAHKKPKKPRKPKGEFLRAFIELPADISVADVNAATVNLCLNDITLATAESPLIVDNILDVLFRLDPDNVGTILGLEVTKVKVDECRIEVTAAAAPSQPIDLIELTVSGDFLYPGSFTGTDEVRVMLGNDERQKR
jgi:hypothetical protein